MTVFGAIVFWIILYFCFRSEWKEEREEAKRIKAKKKHYKDVAKCNKKMAKEWAKQH